VGDVQSCAGCRLSERQKRHSICPEVHGEEMKFTGQSFWARVVSTVGTDEETVREYIR
jgi:hypothetical protein